MATAEQIQTDLTLEIGDNLSPDRFMIGLERREDFVRAIHEIEHVSSVSTGTIPVEVG